MDSNPLRSKASFFSIPCALAWPRRHYSLYVEPTGTEISLSVSYLVYWAPPQVGIVSHPERRGTRKREEGGRSLFLLLRNKQRKAAKSQPVLQLKIILAFQKERDHTQKSRLRAKRLSRGLSLFIWKWVHWKGFSKPLPGLLSWFFGFSRPHGQAGEGKDLSAGGPSPGTLLLDLLRQPSKWWLTPFLPCEGCELPAQVPLFPFWNGCLNQEENGPAWWIKHSFWKTKEINYVQGGTLTDVYQHVMVVDLKVTTIVFSLFLPELLGIFFLIMRTYHFHKNKSSFQKLEIPARNWNYFLFCLASSNAELGDQVPVFLLKCCPPPTPWAPTPGGNHFLREKGNGW